MDEAAFIKENGRTWKLLESEIKYFNRRLGRFRRAGRGDGKERVDRLIVLYNRTANHLAYCRTYYGESETAVYLNKLVGAAHSVIYLGRRPRITSFLLFFVTGFPRTFRRNLMPFLIAAAVMIGGGLFSFFYTAADAENAFAFLAPENVLNMREEGNYDVFSLDFNSMLASFIGTNNIKVCLLAFASGITFGTYTLYILLTNGMLLGAMAGIAFHRGQNAFFWSLILPHGITELFAIFVSGAAGLLIGYSLIFPGKISRKDALIFRAKEGVKLLGGCIPILILSAVIEGYFTPLDLPYGYKYGFAMLMLILLVLYLVFPGRSRAETVQEGGMLPY